MTERQVDVTELLKNGCVFSLGPDSILVGWGQWITSATSVDHARASRHEFCSIYSPDFYETDPKPWRFPEHFRVLSRARFTTDVLAKMTSEVKDFRWSEPSFEGFENQVRIIREEFMKGALEKAVPVVHAKANQPLSRERLHELLRQTVTTPQSLYPYGFWSETEGLLGATPERLFSIEKGVLVTMALAGTYEKNLDPKANASLAADTLMNDPKERREHQIVIDDLTERLEKYGQIKIGETHVAELPTLLHLKTRIEVALVNPELDFSDLVRDLHPTPALGVAPRSFGFKNMKLWDDVSLRGRFGAPFGLRLKTATHDVQDCLVAIRNVQWRSLDGKLQPPTLGSGCGFVRESVVEREWSELALKRDSVRKVLKI